MRHRNHRRRHARRAGKKTNKSRKALVKRRKIRQKRMERRQDNNGKIRPARRRESLLSAMDAEYLRFVHEHMSRIFESQMIDDPIWTTDKPIWTPPIDVQFTPDPPLLTDESQP